MFYFLFVFNFVSTVYLQRCVSFRYVCMLSHSVMSSSLQPRGPWPARLLCPQGCSRQEYWSGLLCPPTGDLPAQGLNPGLPHCRQILYHLSHQGSPLFPLNAPNLKLKEFRNLNMLSAPSIMLTIRIYIIQEYS